MACPLSGRVAGCIIQQQFFWVIKKLILDLTPLQGKHYLHKLSDCHWNEIQFLFWWLCTHKKNILNFINGFELLCKNTELKIFFLHLFLAYFHHQILIYVFIKMSPCIGACKENSSRHDSPFLCCSIQDHAGKLVHSKWKTIIFHSF
jgi:hypothetical protein